MSNKAFKETEPFLITHWGKDFTLCVMKSAEDHYLQLCAENYSDPKPIKAHTESNIYPCISLYNALQEVGVPPDEALSFLDEVWSLRAESGARIMQKGLKFAGLYKLYPAMFRIVAKKQYGANAGFRAKFYDCGKYHCKFDMTQCLFLNICRRYGCPELTKCFCHVDDINNRHLHPHLCWNRTKYMGKGDDFCDFDIFVQD